MSSPIYGNTPTEPVYQRPATISELAARAQDQLWDPSKGLKHWLRTAEKARRNGDYYAEHQDYERAFVEYARAATIVLEKLPTHQDYTALLNPDQRQNLGMTWLSPKSSDVHEMRRGLGPLARRRKWSSIGNGVNRSGGMQRSGDRQARHETALARQQMLELRREEERASAAERRAAEAKAMAERERQAERARREAEARSDDEERRRATEERRRREREGILRRQQEAETAALAARMEVATRLTPSPNGNRSGEETSARGSSRSFPVAAPQPAHAPGSSQQQSLYGTSNGLSVMPLESPTKNDDDSSTDVEGVDRQPWQRQRHTDHTPSKSKQHAAIQYPPPITTTSPAPPDGPIRYPTLMSQHQLKQGYVPSLQSMFSKSTPAPAAPNDSSLLFFDSKAPESQHSHSSSVADPVIPPPPSHMSVPIGHGRQGSITYPQTGRRGPSPSGARLLQTSSASRIVPSTSTDSTVRDLKTVRLPRSCLQRFLSIARVNTLHNRETCGLLLGKDKGNKYVVTTLLIPRQHSTSDTCTMDEEELVLQFTEERHLITLGWIHTHPTQSCFMSSVDLHTHSGFQRMLPESFAVVCAPTSKPTRTAIDEEQAHFSNVIQTFMQYAAYSLSANNRRRKDFFTLPRADQELLHSLRYKEKLAEVDRAILANAEFLNQIVVDPEIFGHELEGIDDPGANDVPASFFILNRTDSVNQHTVYPYVHSFSNLPNNAAMLRPITIPDITPSSLPQGSNFSLVADEPQGGQWDAVLTCFFIDTAKNIVNYLRVIHRILAPGGVWVNLGPLLWHFENNTTNDPSIELTLEEVKTLARKIGFEISNERTIDTTYTNNAQSMLGYVYHAAFWTAKKII
ncbi:hypothetical protein EVJ58_g3544 [Rhodofomes roseus]|uniref:carnosine N-methyltransferase n=1 Tax=Rhodofomes roseus TaxID=34475 RepID=A0A4Y9YLX4_9APHY|nr:hypothetical protein EVJ58_g3544 [Rhodofomes roseus]